MEPWTVVVVVAIVLLLVIPNYLLLRRQERRAEAAQKKAKETGRHEPVSIRPHVDPGRCMGSGACVRACPEKDVLQVINGQAQIVNGSACVGHGACVAACPVGAIELVFGSERRGVDLPDISPRFETNVPGLFIAGELGGMGLIANAVEQGRQAMENVARSLEGASGQADHDVVIVGAGPAGLSAALVAKHKGLRYKLIDQAELGGSVTHFPRQKLVMTRPMHFQGFGTVAVRTLKKEELVQLFADVVKATGLAVHTGQRLEALHADGDGFVVRTQSGEERARRVMLCLGRRGTPRKLDVPGEELEKVAYRLVDPELYQHQHLLVVGAGDSAIEAAVALGAQEGNQVTLAVRGAALGRPKQENIDRLEQAQARGQVNVCFETTVARVELDRVVLVDKGQERVLPNDYVFVMAGGVLPTDLLEKSGITIERHFGKRRERKVKPGAPPT